MTTILELHNVDAAYGATQVLKAVNLVVEQRGGHLGSSGVVGADEQHLRDVGHGHAFRGSACELGGLLGADRAGPGRVDGDG